jgi:hypothetical protein
MLDRINCVNIEHLQAEETNHNFLHGEDKSKLIWRVLGSINFNNISTFLSIKKERIKTS